MSFSSIFLLDVTWFDLFSHLPLYQSQASVTVEQHVKYWTGKICDGFLDAFPYPCEKDCSTFFHQPSYSRISVRIAAGQCRVAICVPPNYGPLMNTWDKICEQQTIVTE